MVNKMVLELRKSERRKSKLRLGISGPAGSGKTYSSLKMAFGITNDWSKIALIDTENGSGDLYANLGEYSVISVSAPYTPERYVEAITLCEKSGIECIIIDSLTHAWAGEGGLLDQHGKITDSSSNKNSWTAWRTVTPKHNALVESMLTSECHIIATMRAKMEYVQDKEDGKTVVRKIGMGSIQRDGMEYEFTVFFELDQRHNAQATKDRTSLFDSTIFNPNEIVGQQLKKWLETGKEESVEDKITNLKNKLNINDTTFNQISEKYQGNKEQILKALEYIKNKPEVKS
jgi:hypothetical protein